jgi:Lipoprotein LpqB beta-propeller domain/Sporulation and spore germination
MKADRRGAGALLAVGLLLLTGCASMPSGGDVKQVDSTPRADVDSQVRVFGVSPQEGADPRQIIRGFLEATTSDEADFDTALKYLTEDERDSWDPFAGTTVLSDAPSVRLEDVRTGSDGEGYHVEVTGTRIAEVDSERAYRPQESPYLERFHLTEVSGEWRIDRLPDGLVMGESEFQRIYRSVATYYFADLGPEAGAVPRGKNVLVPDPLYVRERIDPVTETVRALLKGPTDWLNPVVNSAFPSRVRLARGEHLSLDDSGGLTVPLTAGNGQRVRVNGRQCARMAAQLLHTVDGYSSARVNRVNLNDHGGGELCSQTREAAQIYAPGLLDGQAAKQYFLDGEHRLVALNEGQDTAVPVEGPFGTGDIRMGSVAVRRDERTGEGSRRNGLTAPSWDGLGDLWVADRDPDRSRLLRLRDGQEEAEEVAVPRLGPGRIESLRVSSDGTRIALLVEDDGATTLRLGRIGRERNPRGGSTAQITGLRPVAPQLENVVAASWAGDSRLVVVGKASGGVQQLRVVSTDGSAGIPSKLPGVNNLKGIAASENEDKPLLADSEEGIVRLPRDDDWQEVTGEGAAPVYPG